MKLRNLFLILSLSGCAAKAPDIETCIIDAKKKKAYCDLQDGAKIERNIDELHKYIAIPHKDALNYFGYCKLK